MIVKWTFVNCKFWAWVFSCSLKNKWQKCKGVSLNGFHLISQKNWNKSKSWELFSIILGKENLYTQSWDKIVHKNSDVNLLRCPLILQTYFFWFSELQAILFWTLNYVCSVLGRFFVTASPKLLTPGISLSVMTVFLMNERDCT